MPSMDTMSQKGDKIKETLKEGQEKIRGISDEAKGVVDQLKDIPGEIDDDLKEQIRAASDSAKSEGTSDMQAAKQQIIDKAKTDAAAVIEQTKAKMTANDAMTRKLDAITSKYGKGAIDRSKDALQRNTQMGESLNAGLEKAQQETDQNVQAALDKLSSS